MELILDYFDIILFAILAGYLGIKLYRTLGAKTKVENKINSNDSKKKNYENILNKEAVKNKNIKEPIENEDGNGIDYLKKVYKSFDEKEFLVGAHKAFELIIKAKNEGNKKYLISLLEDNAYRVFEKEILEREINGNSIEDTKLNIINSKIINIKIYKNIAYISVDFNSEQGIYIKKSDGSLLEDTRNELKKYKNTWTFCRPLDADSPNWKLFSV